MKKHVAILATNGFEESELTEPKKAMEAEGFDVDIVSDTDGEIKAWKDGNWSNSYKVDTLLSEANSKNYHALVLPGGVMNPDSLRKDENALNFVRDL